MSACRHCGEPVPAGGGDFCCAGCAGAYRLISGLGLDGWYARRELRAGVRPPRPEDIAPVDPAAYVRVGDDGVASLHLMVDGLHCAACVWLIESLLARQAGVVAARINMTTRRLTLRWRAAENEATALVAAVARLGYRLAPYDPCRLGDAARAEEARLLRALAVAGFAAGNVMLLSVSVWAGALGEMGPATRDFLHWVSALIALPAVAYAGWPFFGSAAAALRARRLNMDVPISLGVVLAAGVSLFETAAGGRHAYFDAAVTLLFFLLVGRYLDRRARARARGAAEHLLGLRANAVTRVAADGTRRAVPAGELKPGDRIAVAAGERIGADSVVSAGASQVDASLVSGESLPVRVAPGDRVFAGTLNVDAPLELEVRAAAADSLLAEIVRLTENAEQGRARYVRLADRVSRAYAPAVHVLGLATLLGWLAAGAGWHAGVLNAVAVLIITCPCALALAVPAVQVVASGRLLQRGMLLKSADALERLAAIDTVVFDKTGTLTEGRPQLRRDTGFTAADLLLAARLAVASRHPLARALVQAAGPAVAAEGLREEPGAGLSAVIEGVEVRLGSRRFCGLADDSACEGPELWLARRGAAPARFAFTDMVRPDARQAVEALRAQGLRVVLLSGDRPGSVAAVAARLGIAEFAAGCSPADKVARLRALAGEGRKVLMVGDGLNDAPALAAAFVSMSPSSAIDISQTAADLVFQGDRLAPVAEAVETARRADRLVRQNLAIAIGYNAVAVPLAMAGLVTPLVAAAAMSASSLTVSVNALRLRSDNGRLALSDTGGTAARPARAGRVPVGA
jgi:Cu2+-exporting ATPase